MLPATSDRKVLRLNMALLPPVIQRYGSGHTRYGNWPDLRLPGLLGTILHPTAALRQRGARIRPRLARSRRDVGTGIVGEGDIGLVRAQHLGEIGMQPIVAHAR